MVTTVDSEPAATVPWWHIFHRWTRWEQGEADVISTVFILGGKRLVQSRHCVRCNLEQVRDYKVRG